MSKVFDSLRVAQQTRSETDYASPGRPEHHDNVVPMGQLNMQYWQPDLPMPAREKSRDRYLIAIIVILAAGLLTLGGFVLMPQTRLGKGGDNAEEGNRQEIERAIKDKQQSTSARESSPADPLNLATTPFELVTDSAATQRSEQAATGLSPDSPQTSTNAAPLQAQNPIVTNVPANVPAQVTAPVPVNPSPQTSSSVPEKGRFVITENTRGADPANSEIASPGAPAAGSKKDLENQFKMAVFQHRNGDILKAYQGYEYVLGYDPYNLEAHNNLGLIFQEIGKYEDALREFGKVLAIDPKNVQAINNSGVTYFKMQDYTAAVRKFEAALEIDPNNSESYANLGLVYVQLDRVADAKAVFLKVLAMNPRHAETHYNLANLYEKNGQLKDAIFYYQKFLSYSAGTYGSIVRETEKHVDELYQKVQADGTPGGAKSPSVSGQAPPSKIPL